MSIVTCSQCGHAAPPDARQCPKCGVTLGSRPRVATSTRFQPGDIIDGRYEVLERLPGGGMGELYKVRHVHLGEFRVIKLLRGDQLTDETQRKRFFQEARIAASIRNANVGLLHDFASLSDGTFYMVEEHIDGLTISRSLRAGRRFTLGEIVEIARQVLCGLVAIHEKGIIHRDISPDNIMLCQHDGALQARIIDLGIAKSAAAGEGQALTSAGLFLGKPHYASPEQMRMMESDETIDHRTDLYSLGVVIYEMIVGKVPFEAATPLAYLLKQISEEVHTVNRDVSGVVPPELDAFIVRLLKTKRDERFASARDALRALDEVTATIPQLLLRRGTDATPLEESFPRTTPVPRREGTDEIPFAQLAAIIERDKTEPGTGPGRSVELMTRDDDDTQPTEVQSFEGLMSSTQPYGRVATLEAATLPTLPSGAVATPAGAPDRTVPATRAVPEPPPPIGSGTAPAPKRATNRALVFGLASLAFVAVVATGGWLLFLLLDAKLGGKGESATEAASTQTSATETTSVTASTVMPAPARATTAPAATTIAPPPVETATPARTPVAEPPPAKAARTPKKPAAPPVETAAPETIVETAEPPPSPEPVEPAVREGDIVAPGDGVAEAQLLRKVEPMVPPTAAVMGARGFAMFSVLVAIDGSVEQARLIRSSGSAAFDELATAAAKKTIFTPATKEGVRVRMWRTLRYDVKVRGTM